MQTDTSPDTSPDTTPSDFSADGVDDFGPAGAFVGTLPGEQAPSTAPTGAANDIDALMAGVDLTDATEALNDGKKVKFSGNVVGVKPWNDPNVPGRVCLVFDIVPTSPPVCAAAGKQSYWADLKGPDVAKTNDGAAKIRALAVACGKLPMQPSTFVGCVIEGKMNKAKKTGKIYLDFAA